MNGLTAAKGLRRSLEESGGVMRISVPALGDAFGRGKLTTRAKTGIEQVLGKAGIEVIPGLNDPANDGWVTLRLAQTSAPLPPVVRGPGSVGPQIREVRPHRHLRPAPFLAAALAFLVPVLLVIALASPDANRPGRAAADTQQTRPSDPSAQASALERAETALLAGDYRLAVRLTREADPSKVRALRQRIATSLTTQARAAMRQRAFVRAIKLARRAARYGRAPGASAIVRESREGLDLRREAQRRAEREAADAEASAAPEDTTEESTGGAPDEDAPAGDDTGTTTGGTTTGGASADDAG